MRDQPSLAHAATTGVYRAVDQPVESRAEYWRHVMDDVLFPSDLRFGQIPGERDWIRTGSLGAMKVADWSSGPKYLKRTARHIRDIDHELLAVIAPMAPVRGSRGGDRYLLSPTSLTLSALRDQLVCVHGPSRGVHLVFPRSLSPVPPPELRRVQGVPIDAGRGVAALARSTLLQLSAHLDDADPAVGTQLGSAVLGLLGAAYAGSSSVRLTDSETSRAALLAQIRSFVADHLHDPSLGPASIAAAHHLSVRTLHKLFEGDECTVAVYVRRRRLESCRDELASPAARARSVEAIARSRGFVSLSHFSRLFRDTYGVPPGEYRRLAAEMSADHEHLTAL